jgi:hypothetical protein
MMLFAAMTMIPHHPNEAPTWVRYRRPRQFRELPRSFPRMLRLAARGAMPSRPSLLYTIAEVDESAFARSKTFQSVVQK